MLKILGDQSEFNLQYRLNDFLPLDTKSFYRYLGSLTTPTCSEVVVWTVFTSPVPISESQVTITYRHFKTIFDNYPIGLALYLFRLLAERFPNFKRLWKLTTSWQLPVSTTKVRKTDLQIWTDSDSRLLQDTCYLSFN